jgi:hypothetical protein
VICSSLYLPARNAPRAKAAGGGNAIKAQDSNSAPLYRNGSRARVEFPLDSHFKITYISATYMPSNATIRRVM